MNDEIKGNSEAIEGSAVVEAIEDSEEVNENLGYSKHEAQAYAAKVAARRIAPSFWDF